MKHHVILSLLIASAIMMPAAEARAAERADSVEHVILIGLDGWGAYSMPMADMPTVKSLMETGGYSLHKRSEMPTVSAPNWATMFMGVPVEVHGYTKWDSKSPEIPPTTVNDHGIFPTIFSATRQQEPEAEIGVLYEWDGIKHVVDTLALSYHAQGINTEENPDNLCNMAVDYIVGHRPRLMAVIFDEPDHTGHTAGHNTPEYYKTLERLDHYVGRIVGAVAASGMADNTVIIVTGDHGGINKGHGGITLQELQTPFVIAGPGIKHDYRLDRLMLQQDIAPTIARLLGIEAPQEWTGRPVVDFME